MMSSGRHNSEMRGIVFVNELGLGRVGASRSISYASPEIEKRGVKLDFYPTRSWKPLLRQAMAKPGNLGRKPSFVLFNSMNSFGGRSRAGLPLLEWFTALGVPTMIYWHETDWVFEYLRTSHPAQDRRMRRILNARKVIHLTASEATSRSVSRAFEGARPVELYECVETPGFLPPGFIAPKLKIIMNIASVQARKGPDLFLKTAAKVIESDPQALFIWLGDGPDYLDCLRESHKPEYQGRVLFPGYTEPSSLLLAMADVLFLSSRDDPFPLAVLEAMSLGKPVVAFDSGGAPEAIAGTGAVVPPFETEAAAKAILAFLAEDEPQKSEQRIHRFRELYSPPVFAERFLQILQGVIGRTG